MLSIQSQGEIDVNALRLMGASVKGDDAIGEFGSGLKYAIACLLREKVFFRVYSGLTPIELSTVTESFRGSDFEVILINGERTSLTTRTGPKWTPREAVRELWSNALDEGEAQRYVNEAAIPRPGITTLHIGSHPMIDDMLANWSQYFLGNTPSIFQSAAGSIHIQPTPNFFRKGVWICQEAVPLPLFSYSFSDLSSPDLPESRLVSSASCTRAISLLLSDCTSSIVAGKLIGKACDHMCLEWRALYAYNYNINPPLIATVQETFFELGYTHVGHSKNKQFVESRIRSDQHVLWCVESSYSVMVYDIKIPCIEDALDHNDRYEIKPWPIGVEAIVRERVAFLAKHDIIFPKEVQFKYAEFKAEGSFAEADMKRKLCLLSGDVANVGQTRLTQALIEEWTHLAHGVSDHTPAQQHVYLNLITGLLGCGSLQNLSSPSPSFASLSF